MDYTTISSDPTIVTFAALLLAAFMYLVIFYSQVFFRVGIAKPVAPDNRTKGFTSNSPLPPVSVVLVVHNESESLRNNLVYLLEQDYPKYEVVVVEYRPNEETHIALSILAEHYHYLRIITLGRDVNGYRGKKWPLSLGIQSAQYDHILLTEVDCLPVDKEHFNWIRQMMGGYNTTHTAIVLGYCAIQPKRSLFNWIQQYDNLAYSVRYLSAAIRRHPFTGNGQNLSYLRSLFLSTHGFIYNYFVPYGDDDLIVQRCATSSNTTCALNEDSFTTIAPQPTLRAWHGMRLRRTATYSMHSFSLRLLHALYPLSIVLFYLFCALIWALGLLPWYFPATFLLVKLIVQYGSVICAAKRLNIPNGAVVLAPLFELYFLFANAIAALVPMSKR